MTFSAQPQNPTAAQREKKKEFQPKALIFFFHPTSALEAWRQSNEGIEDFLSAQGFSRTTHHSVAVARIRLNLPGRQLLRAVSRGPAELSIRHVPLILRPTWVRRPIPQHCHLDAVPGIPEGAHGLLVGRPLHVEAVDLE